MSPVPGNRTAVLATATILIAALSVAHFLVQPTVNVSLDNEATNNPAATVLGAVEFKILAPGNYMLVDHALSRAERGLVGMMRVDGSVNTAVDKDEHP
jgi:hypothetical protein